jgi:ferric-dicitrate binding protein FerR (iron transport regulator)
MKRTDRDLDAILDRVAADVSADAVDQSVVDAAAGRVLSRLAGETAPAAPGTTPIVERIRGCADFQALIPAYLLGALPEARVLLLEDHTRECIPCRKALKQAREGRRAAAPAAVAPSRSRTGAFKRAIAAALVLGMGYMGVYFVQNVMYSGGTAEAVVQTVNGLVQRVADEESREVAAGARVGAGERLRTARGANAVIALEDGSLVEMAERSEVSLTKDAGGTTIHLDRGNIVVQAAKQRTGHLYVATEDCLVSVTGTIFSVNNGTKGSRVSVIEGEVHVDFDGADHVLGAGAQVATEPTLTAVPVRDEVLWSRDAARYAEMLAGIAGAQDAIAAMPRPGVRYSTRLLDLAPEGTVFYAAIPNLSATLAESHRILRQRIGENAALREWWGEQHDAELDRIVDRVEAFGAQLGPEIVVAAEMDDKGEPVGPLVLAELNDPAAFRTFLAAQLAELPAPDSGPAVTFVEDPRAAAPKDERDGLYVWIDGNVLAATPVRDQLARVGTGGFSASPFHGSIASLYSEGAGLVLAADLQQIVARAVPADATPEAARDREGFRQLGLFDLRDFIAEQRELDGSTRTRAVLTFNERRTGIASWLADPGPMKALEFVSPNANVATAFVVREPVALVDDLLNFLGTVSPDVRNQLTQIEAEHGIDVRRDLAAPLGGEFAFAIDGPVLPTPSWKMVFEVYDPAHLQQTFERLVATLNERAGKQVLTLERAEAGGRSLYAIKSADTGLEVHYAFAAGYLVAGPSRGLVENSLRHQESDYTLLNSPRFAASLPADGNVNFSALIYHDLAPLVEPFASRIGSANGQLSEEEQRAIKSLATAAPTLLYAYAEGNRITFASDRDGGPFGLSPTSLLGMPGTLGLQQVLGKAMKE